METETSETPKNPPSRGRSALLDASARILVAAVLSALVLAVVDTFKRTSWNGVPLGTHLIASVSIFTVVGALGGLLAAAIAACGRVLPSPRWRAVGAAALAAASLHGTAVWLFTGRFARTTSLVKFGPYLLTGLAAVGVGAIALFALRAVRDARDGRSKRPTVTAMAGFALAACLIAADLTLFVSLYGRLHTLLELTAAIASTVAITLLLTATTRTRPRLARVVRGAAAVAVVWAVAFAAVPRLRFVHENALRHAWREPVYAGRTLRRVRMAEASLGLRTQDDTTAATPVALLQDRFDIDDTTLHPRWRGGPAESPELQADLARLRDGKTDYDLLVYYVDTLRQDVATNAGVMPRVSRFARESMNFRRAYATGSDTLHSLPSLVGGRYGSDASCNAAILPTAKRANVPTSLFIPESAYQFLAALFPGFAFDHVERVRDHEDSQGVWGYGADRSTASAIVDRTLEWLEREKPARHVTWLFNFDLHNWRELERPHLDAVADRYKIPEEGEWNWQYRVVARSLDGEFGRLLDGLERLGRKGRTIVLFVSDHGEGLGYQGFWVHSVFLWESLVRAPLMLRVPGLAPKAVDETVSLVDVAPTIARFLEPEVTLDDCHGVDLLGYATPRPSPHLPVLMAATTEGQITKLGIVEGPRKLVVPLDWGEPQLYDLTSTMPDEADVAELERSRLLGLVDELIRSPIFERASTDETVHASR